MVMSLMVMLMNMVSKISMISMICSNHGMGLHACYCCYVVIVIVGIVVIVVIVIVAIVVIVVIVIGVIVVIVVRTYVCMLLLMMLALVFSHPTRHETMKLLLASATSLVTRVAYGRLKHARLNGPIRHQTHHCHEAFSFHRPRAGAGWAASASCWHSASTAPELALDGRLPLPAGMNGPIRHEAHHCRSAWCTLTA